MSSKKIVAAALSASLLFSSTATAAASSPAPASQSQASWLALSMLTPSGSAGLAGAAVQLPPADSTPPPPAAYGGIQAPPIPVITIWLATLVTAIYILTKHHHGRFFFGRSGSPA